MLVIGAVFEANHERKHQSNHTLKIGLPKGSMQSGVLELLAAAGIRTKTTSRSYRPALGLTNVDAKLLKPQTIIEMLAMGSRDVGFAGADWVAELEADVVEILDTGLILFASWLQPPSF